LFRAGERSDARSIVLEGGDDGPALTVEMPSDGVQIEVDDHGFLSYYYPDGPTVELSSIYLPISPDDSYNHPALKQYPVNQQALPTSKQAVLHALAHSLADFYNFETGNYPYRLAVFSDGLLSFVFGKFFPLSLSLSCERIAKNMPAQLAELLESR